VELQRFACQSRFRVSTRNRKSLTFEMEYPKRWKQRNAWLNSPDSDIRLHYIDCSPPSETASKGTILLIHGFPQTYTLSRAVQHNKLTFVGHTNFAMSSPRSQTLVIESLPLIIEALASPRTLPTVSPRQLWPTTSLRSYTRISVSERRSTSSAMTSAG